MPSDERPEVVLTSPYLRAQRTAALIRDVGGLADNASEPLIDERLREKELGILDGLASV
jgi:broad specificity phosphatase PhoE